MILVAPLFLATIIASSTATGFAFKETVTTTFAVDAVIESITGAGAVVAKAMVVEHVGGVLHYIQNEVTGFGTFNASNNIRLEGTSGSGVDVTAVTAPLINHHSGTVMFIENRTSTTRDTGQIETVRLVIAF